MGWPYSLSDGVSDSWVDDRGATDGHHEVCVGLGCQLAGPEDM